MESRIIVTAELSQIRGRLDILQRLKYVGFLGNAYSNELR